MRVRAILATVFITVCLCGCSPNHSLQAEQKTKNDIVICDKTKVLSDGKIHLPGVTIQGGTFNTHDICTEIDIIATEYTSAQNECGRSDGKTASGVYVSLNKTIAADISIPFGTRIKVPELNNNTYIVEDRGASRCIKIDADGTYHIDIYVLTKKEAFDFGVRKFKGYIYKFK